MRGMVSAALLAAVVSTAAPAAAQGTAAPQRPPTATQQPPSGSALSIAGLGGAAAVQELGGLAGAEIGFRLNERLSVIGEGVWLQNTVTRRRLDLAASVGSVLQTQQGAPTTSTVVAPSFYGAGGVRFMLMTHGTWRPFVAFTAGMARISLRPEFTLGGADVTASLPTYGITLGSDLTGDSSEPAFSGVFGVRMLHGQWYVDGSFGVIAIQTEGQSTNVLRANAGFGFRF